MNYTLIYEIISLTIFAIAAAGVMTLSFVEKRYGKLNTTLLRSVKLFLYHCYFQSQRLSLILLCFL